MAELLAAVLAVLWAVAPAPATEAQLSRLSDTLFEITGGTGASAWRLRYGTQVYCKKQVIAAGQDRAWFTHAGWLRLMDTRQGVVLGRWHFPGQIVAVTPEGTKWNVQVEDYIKENQAFRRVIGFDPANPQIPYWPTNQPIVYRLVLFEVPVAWPSVNLSGTPAAAKPSPEEARRLIRDLEDAVRRDSFTPWLRLTFAKVLRDAGDPRARPEFEQATSLPSADFTELFRISAVFDQFGERDLARAAFDRAYKDFLEKGNDPRLFVSLFGRLTLGALPSLSENLDPEYLRELQERIYKLMPYGEFAEYAWQLLAEDLAKRGLADQAQLWRARAEDARANSPFPVSLTRNADRGIFTVPACMLAALVFFVVLFARYEPQRRLDVAKRRQLVAPSSSPSLIYFKSWTLGERIGFVAVVVVAWLLAFLKMRTERPVDGLFPQAFFAAYFWFPAALIYVLVVHFRHRRQKREPAEVEGESAKVEEFAWLNYRRWSWPKRLGFLTTLTGGLVIGYLEATTEAEPFPLVLQAIYPALAFAMVYLLILYILDLSRRRKAEAGAGLRPGFGWFNLVYWSGRERVAFLTIGLVVWFGVGMATSYVAAILRMASAPFSGSMGSLADLSDQVWLENNIPASADRDWLLAYSYQGSGETEKAERLYRALPQFAESWNNLGVILKDAGKDQEAQRAFERALQMDPKLAEAALNLGRPPQDFWTEQHHKYLPGRLMLAPPRSGRFANAMLGGSARQIFLRALFRGFFGGFTEVGKLAG